MGFNYFLKIALTVFLFSFLLPGKVLAEIKSGTTEIGLSAGALFADSEVNNDNSFQLNLSLGANITNNVGVELSLLNSFDSLSDSPTASFITANAAYKFLPDADINPYFLLGVGSGTFGDSNNNSARFTASGGVGLYFSYWENVALRLDFRDYMTFNEITHNLSTSLGIMYVFDFTEPLEPAPTSIEEAVPYRPGTEAQSQPISRPIEVAEVDKTVAGAETIHEPASGTSFPEVGQPAAEEVEPAEEEYESFEEAKETIEEITEPIKEEPAVAPAPTQAEPTTVAPIQSPAATVKEEIEPLEEFAHPEEEIIEPIEEMPSEQAEPEAITQKPAGGKTTVPAPVSLTEKKIGPVKEITGEPIEEIHVEQATPEPITQKPAAGKTRMPSSVTPAEKKIKPVKEITKPTEEVAKPLRGKRGEPTVSEHEGKASTHAPVIPGIAPAVPVVPVTPPVTEPAQKTMKPSMLAEKESTTPAVPGTTAKKKPESEKILKRPTEVIKTAEKASLYELHVLYKGAMLGIDFPFQNSEITSRSFDLILELIAYMRPRTVNSISILPLSSEYESIQEISDIGQERASMIIDMFERNSTIDKDLFTIVAPDRVRLRKFYDESDGRTNRVYIIVSFD